ncbi:MAG: orotidine-5'-phosphate decarboxylase [Actinomycetaceae bacterium]|nr:orotidine-5'-phosphate decarboxylase [Actinomycetaceae bacterium]
MAEHTTFGNRLAGLMSERGPVCAGIDPHPALLAAWGLDDSAGAVRDFSMRTVDALYEHAAAFKPQSAFYERHGAAGVAALEETLAACRQAGVPAIADVKRGDIGSTMDGYADAYLSGPLRCDAMTVSPYLGPASLEPTARRAADGGQGLFVLALTSNPEGRQVQHAGGPDSVARRVVAAVAQWNRDMTPDGVGSFGLVVGATVGDAAARLGIDLAAFPGIFLAPGVGAQGAGGAELARVFGSGLPRVLASASRSILSGGPSAAGLREGLARTLDDVASALT